MLIGTPWMLKKDCWERQQTRPKVLYFGALSCNETRTGNGLNFEWRGLKHSKSKISLKVAAKP